MNTSSLNGLSPNYLQSMLSHQLTTNNLNAPSKNGATADASPFAQLMSDLNTAANLSAPKVSKSSNFFQQMMSLI